MAIISIDSSSDSLYVALKNNNEIIQRCYPDLRRADKMLLQSVLDIMKDANITLSDVEYFVISSGPGSFTSLRISASVTKGFTYSKGVRIKSVSSLLTLANSYAQKSSNAVVVPLIDARMNRFYSAFFKNGKRLTEDEDISFENILKKPYNEIVFVTHPDEREKVLSLIDKDALLKSDKTISFAQKNEICNPSVIMINLAKDLEYDDFSKGPKYVREHSGLCRE